MSDIGLKDLKQVLELCTKYNVSRVKYDDVEVEMRPPVPTYGGDDKIVMPTDDEIGLNPYIGLEDQLKE